eukprot:TRINITY_DN65741_c0_g1_i1.p3 TRINITY_DN65741_c0_g1~~TRINITY_DN65741_c0_g1_i1.p3  ORF type:complete len:161 (-),score=26.62 TRINITY_DN65741_c0_g1_i1:311-793(-)
MDVTSHQNEMLEIMRIMNLPEQEYQTWISAQDEDGPHALYMAALNEFVSRAGSFDFDWDVFEILPGFDVSSTEEEALRACSTHSEASSDFRQAVMDYGGYKEDASDDGEDTCAWNSWANQGINGFSQSISATSFLNAISRQRTFVWTILGETANIHEGTS